MGVLDSLERCLLFAGLPFEVISQIRAQSPVIFLRPGEVLLSQGQRSERDLFVVLEGAVELHVRDEAVPVRIETLGPGEVLGEIGIFWPHPRIATVIASRASRLLKITSVQLEKFQALPFGPYLMLNVVCLLSNRIEAMNEQLASQTQIGLKLDLPPARFPVSLLPEDITERPSVVATSQPLQVGNVLEGSPLGEFLGTVYRDDLGRMLDIRRYEVPSLIFREGDPSTDALLICSGSVQVSRSLEGGELILATIGPGELVGEMGLFRELPRSATARTMSPVVALQLPKAFASALLEQKPGLASRLLAYTAQLLEKRLILLNDLCARMQQLQRLTPARPTLADPQQLYLDYRLLQYFFTLCQKGPTHHKELLRDWLTALQQLGRNHPELEVLCRQKPVTLAPPMLAQGMEPSPDEQAATQLIESMSFCFNLRLAQHYTFSLSPLLQQIFEQEQQYFDRLALLCDPLFAELAPEQRLNLRWKVMQNLGALQKQAVQAFTQLGFPAINQEQGLRLGREWLQPFLERLRQMTA